MRVPCIAAWACGWAAGGEAAGAECEARGRARRSSRRTAPALCEAAPAHCARAARQCGVAALSARAARRLRTPASRTTRARTRRGRGRVLHARYRLRAPAPTRLAACPTRAVLAPRGRGRPRPRRSVCAVQTIHPRPPAPPPHPLAAHRAPRRRTSQRGASSHTSPRPLRRQRVTLTPCHGQAAVSSSGGTRSRLRCAQATPHRHAAPLSAPAHACHAHQTSGRQPALMVRSHRSAAPSFAT